ncbi:MAG: PIN domain-containing protein [Patescibacteria group bacterium]
MNIVVDTSVIVDFLRTGKGLLVKLLELAGKEHVSLYIPTVVILELWKGRSMEDAKVEKKVNRILQAMKVVPLSKQLAKDAGILMRRGFIGNFVDSSISATSVYLDAQLATRNRKHFEKVRGLKLFELPKS